MPNGITQFNLQPTRVASAKARDLPGYLHLPSWTAVTCSLLVAAHFIDPKGQAKLVCSRCSTSLLRNDKHA